VVEYLGYGNVDMSNHEKYDMRHKLFTNIAEKLKKHIIKIMVK